MVAVADLTKLQDIEAVVEKARVAGGRIDAPLNIAGIGGMNQAMSPDAEVQTMIATKLLAPIRLMRAVIPIMQAQCCGTIVNVGSVKGSAHVPVRHVSSSKKVTSAFPLKLDGGPSV